MDRSIYGFLIGVGAGVCVGMLVAPRSGEKTRSLIRGKAREGAAYLRQRGSDVRDAAADTIRDGVRKVDAVKAAVEAGKQAFSASIHS